MIAKNMLNGKIQRASRHWGVTIVEVLFAMVIALIGLTGVLAILPLASRQAADSYTLNQATSTALGAAAEITARDSVAPTTQQPWCYDEDDDVVANSPPVATTYPLRGTFAYKPITSIGDMYEGLMWKAYYRLGQPPTQKFIWRQVYGQGFCFDPLYYGSLNSEMNGGTRLPTYLKSDHIIRRTTFPFVNENCDVQVNSGVFRFYLNGNAALNPNINPVALPSPGARLIRVSAWSPSFLGPVRKSIANALVGGLGDLIRATNQQDESFGAIREFQGVDNFSLISSAASNNLTWFGTLVPNESPSDAVPSNFMLSVVICNRRDTGFELPAPTLPGTDELPNFEKVVLCTAPTTTQTAGVLPTNHPPTAFAHLPMSNGGVLNVEMFSDDRTSANLRVGAYVMLSRTMRYSPPDVAINGPRFVYRHKWYRIVGVDDRDAWPRLVTLQGPAWNYPELPAAPTPAQLSEARTIATIVPDAVAVYEYPITVGN